MRDMSAPISNSDPATNATPAESQFDQLMNHEYDGIREYDNPLPFWWVWLWAASFFFSIGYVAWYHVGKGPSVLDNYEVAVTRHIEKQLAGLGELRADDATILRLMADESMMEAVGGMFRGNCAQCHGNEGAGNIGPNLTDDAYKSISAPADLYTVISDGIPGTSMPAWSQRLREPQMILLAAYVAHLRGTTPTGSVADPIAGERPIPAWSEFESAPDAASEPAPDAAAGGSDGASAG
jgi:cytochrome c oxidase cbb3-type subunit 3